MILPSNRDRYLVAVVAENLPTLPPLVIGNLHIKRYLVSRDFLLQTAIRT
jgi:hypothetical protein